MKAAVVKSFSNSPQYENFTEPTAQPGETIVKVSAAALSPLVKAQASGKHYSSRDAVFPFIPGVDGVGRLSDGKRVYFAFPKSPYGSMGELAAIQTQLCVPVPDNLDDVTAAAIANPGMSSWAALIVRAKFVPGETVLINGATGSAGGLAIQIAKHLGAKKIIATGRNQSRLDELPALGADVVISLEQSAEDLTRKFREEIGAGIDIILDYLWGSSAEQLIAATSSDGLHRTHPPLRFVQIGSISGNTISMPAAALRSSKLELLGSGLGSVSNEDLVASIGAMLNAVVPAKFQIETEAVSLKEVESAWLQDTGDKRLVFRIE